MSDKLIGALASRLSGTVVGPDQIGDEDRTNFGRIFTWVPRMVVRPAHAGDVQAVLRFAAENRLHVATRGAAHSQSQIAISDHGILLDMKSMDAIGTVDTASRTVEVESGAVWRDVARHTLRDGLIPRVLTNNLGVTVGGTLSMAGIGVASFRYGAQGDNVAELDVVTGQGELVTCTREKNADLFWGVLAGLGQIGIVTRARLELRACKPMTRTYYLLYDDLRRFMEDARTAMDCGLWDYLESWASPCPQGTKPVAGARQVFARWFYPFHLTVEFEPGHPPDDAKLLAGLTPYQNLYTDDIPTSEFAERLVPVFEIWKRAGTWEFTHPWMEVVMPWDTAADYIDQVLPDLPPGLVLGGGHALLWPAKGDTSNLKLFMRPEGSHLIGFGILPAVPHKFWPVVKELLMNASMLSVMMGGKRYLSGFVEYAEEQWAEHYGAQWEPFRALKKQHDPAGILNPGFIPLL
ncbi:MAG: FAD-binding protein [Acidobacteriota bacterium]